MDSASRDERADVMPTPAGQIAGMIREAKPARQVIEEMTDGARRVLAELADIGIQSESPLKKEALSS
jgi:NAD(P)H-dependent flavin oxidoreductase YrpB (nitropropane dioxygenase family)